MCLQASENCKSLILQDKCNIEIVLSPGAFVTGILFGFSFTELFVFFLHVVFHHPGRQFRLFR